MPDISSLENAEGAGKAGPAPGALEQKKFARAQKPQVQAVITPAFPAQWFTAYSALSSVNFVDCHRCPRDALGIIANLSASLWGARTTRFRRPRRCRTFDSINPSTAFRTTFVTTRTPLVPVAERGELSHDFRKNER
jgi:hypothetical protein